MSILEPEASKELERGPLTFDVLAVLFVPVGISRIGPTEPVAATPNFGAILGLIVVVAALLFGLIYSARTKDGPDEWVSQNWHRACAMAVLAALVADMVWSLSSGGHLVRPMSANDLLGVQMITLGMSWLWLRWRS